MAEHVETIGRNRDPSTPRGGDMSEAMAQFRIFVAAGELAAEVIEQAETNRTSSVDITDADRECIRAAGEGGRELADESLSFEHAADLMSRKIGG